jgi:hypothetical protein
MRSPQARACIPRQHYQATNSVLSRCQLSTASTQYALGRGLVWIPTIANSRLTSLSGVRCMLYSMPNNTGRILAIVSSSDDLVPPLMVIQRQPGAERFTQTPLEPLEGPQAVRA